MSRPVLLLGRPGCHLCEEFREELERAFPGRFDVREACVDDAPDWQRRYGLRIPVLLDEQGGLLCATRFDPDSLLPDSLPPDSLPPDSLLPDSLPPDSLPPDSHL